METFDKKYECKISFSIFFIAGLSIGLLRSYLNCTTHWLSIQDTLCIGKERGKRKPRQHCCALGLLVELSRIPSANTNNGMNIQK